MVGFAEFGRYGDPADSLLLYQTRLESRCYDNLEECRFLWDDIMSRHGREAKYWIQYADMERCAAHSHTFHFCKATLFYTTVHYLQIARECSERIGWPKLFVLLASKWREGQAN